MADKSVEAEPKSEPEPEAVAVPAPADAAGAAGSDTPATVEIVEAVVNDSTCMYYMRYTGSDGKLRYVVRRYSEFDELRASCAGAAATVEDSTPFPPKVWWGAWQAAVVEERQTGLEAWTNALLALEGGPPPELRAFLKQEASDVEVTQGIIGRLEDPLVAQAGASPDEFVQYAEAHGADGKQFATAADACMNIELAKSGVAAAEGTTLTQLFTMAKDLGGDKKALWWEEPLEDGGHAIREWTWNEYYDDTMAAARSFIELGVEAFGAVSIIGFNTPQWHMSCLGAMAAGAKAAGIYATNEPDACKYIVDHSESSVVVVENAQQMAKFTDSGILKELPRVKALVQYTGKPTETAVANAGEVKCLSWVEFLEVGAQDTGLLERLEERKAAQKPGHCCSLIYTSGTTGPPKAVMISHDNACWTSMAFLTNETAISQPGGEHTIVSYLPLSHIAAQALDIFFPVVGVAGMGAGADKAFDICVYFARPDAIRGSLRNTLNVARPTLFFAVPRVWEKFMEALRAIAKAKGATVTGSMMLSVSGWAKEKMSEAYKESQAGGAVGWTPWNHFAADAVTGKIRAQLGLDRCQFMYTGAAPVTRETLEYFGSLGIKILELYGMSENTGPMTVSNDRMNGARIGAAGLPLSGCELKIDHLTGRDKPGEGEICFRGRHIMMGYLKDDAKTADAIDTEGWLHSGDVGSIDRYGLLHITGRIKELIITAGGENIAPVPCEDSIKLHSQGAVSNVVMIGDKMKYNTCLITLRQVPDLATEGGFTDELFGNSLEVSPASKTVTAAKADPTWTAYIQKGIDAYNKVAVSNAQKIQKFTILDADFSVPGGELTATQKLKRAVVDKKYAAVIAAMY